MNRTKNKNLLKKGDLDMEQYLAYYNDVVEACRTIIAEQNATERTVKGTYMVRRGGQQSSSKPMTSIEVDGEEFDIFLL